MSLLLGLDLTPVPRVAAVLERFGPVKTPTFPAGMLRRDVRS